MSGHYELIGAGVMKRVCAIVFLSLAVIGLGIGGALAQASGSSISRVVGGRDADPGEWPWQISLEVHIDGTQFHNCGGTIIHPRIILTAAHCVVVEGDDGELLVMREDVLRIRSGLHYQRTGGSLVRVAAMVVHPEYRGIGPESVVHDVALIELAEPVSETPVILADADFHAAAIQDGTPVVVTGWGRTTVSPQSMEETVADAAEISKTLGLGGLALQEGELEVFADTFCRDFLGFRTVDERLLCAGSRTDIAGSCQGDSGGPLVVFAEGQFVQVGVVSFGLGLECGLQDRPGVFARVATYRPWIEDVTGLELPAPPAVSVAALPAPDRPAPDAPADSELVIPSVAPGDRVLLIGLDTYRETAFSFDQPASTEDVRNIRGFLERTMGFKSEQILELTNSQATRSNVLEAIDRWLVDGSRPGDRVWFYFSGHGYYQIDDNGDEIDDRFDEVLILHDTVPVDSSVQPVRLQNALSDDDLGRALGRLTGRSTVVMVDSCHAGTITRGVGALAQRGALSRSLRDRLVGMPKLAATGGTGSVTRTIVPEGVDANADVDFTEAAENAIVWSAVAAYQIALIDKFAEPWQGAFTRRFVTGVEDRAADQNGDGRVTNGELLRYLRKESEAYCREVSEHCPSGLTPQLEGPPRTIARDVITGEVLDDVSNSLGPVAEGELDLQILPSTRVALGETVTFAVTAETGGNLLLFQIDARGALTQLFPNFRSLELNPTRTVPGGRRVIVPDASYGFEFAAQRPTGKGLLVAVVSRDPIDLEDMIRGNVDFETVDDPNDYIDRIAQELLEPHVGAASSRPVDYSVAYRSFEISE